GGIPVPIGSFTGIGILSGLGSEIKIPVASVQNVVCEFSSEFTSKGINQTLHRVYLTVTATCNVILPSKNKETVSETDILLCENLIIGEIPSVYLNQN
ncbi:MAG: sporulation protein YunB, partial [Clostridia bacterium]|nr:sporulation protein YunB [Clostridia bacterium]